MVEEEENTPQGKEAMGRRVPLEESAISDNQKNQIKSCPVTDQKCFR